jgi:hypothetical protein
VDKPFSRERIQSVCRPLLAMGRAMLSALESLPRPLTPDRGIVRRRDRMMEVGRELHKQIRLAIKLMFRPPSESDNTVVAFNILEAVTCLASPFLRHTDARKAMESAHMVRRILPFMLSFTTIGYGVCWGTNRVSHDGQRYELYF